MKSSDVDFDTWFETLCDLLLDEDGINRHRAMHREKKEDCKITYTHGDTYTFEFSKTTSKSASIDNNNQ
ncbi:MAG: hypothetical protein GW898_10345 [Thiomicrospira sp.]|nr:hypothetical protein [Thiomicrospira sp.]NCN66302.1 hypothetical protein [Thiomicrospira sp.]NCO14755.1 hypothetical protein [Thiomicrospira sp.]NCO82352.1 hypothetical protein [Thiomicrospira sp.]OIP95181.1 MAG: hypothetical protein AUK56_06500 [Thiomicrospira sp. CG2_30_44_34]